MTTRIAAASRIGAEPTEEAALLARVRAGEAPAWEEFVRTYCGRMYAVAQRLLGGEHDAADAVQDALVSAFRSIDGFAGDAQLGTWLHRIVVNACLMRLRAARSRPAISIDALLPAFDETGHHRRPVRPWSPEPEADLGGQELRERVRACIHQLPEPYRLVVLLRDIEQLDTRETAGQLGISEAAVKVRLHRARQALCTLLEPHFAAAGARRADDPPAS